MPASTLISTGSEHVTAIYKQFRSLYNQDCGKGLEDDGADFIIRHLHFRPLSSQFGVLLPIAAMQEERGSRVRGETE